MNIGDRIREFGLSKFETLTAFALNLGTSPQSLNQYINGDRMPGSNILNKLSDLGCSIDWLLTGEGDMLKQNLEPNITSITQLKSDEGVPFYEIDVTGSIVESFNDIREEPAFYVNYKPFNDCLAYLPIFGDSMSPTYSGGDVIAIKSVSNYEAILWGEAYLIITNANANNLRTVKLLYPHKNKDKVILRAINPKYHGDTVINKEDILNLFIIKGVIKQNM